MKTILIEVKGRVHHVGFRYYTLQTAKRFSIQGYVKNLPNNTVQVEASGNDSDLEIFVDYLKIGPSMARVNEINIQDIPDKEFHGFIIK